MRGTTCHAAAASKGAAVELSAVSRAERMLPPVQQVGSSQSMHGSTCHAAAASQSAAVELNAAPCAERMLPPYGQQLIDAWHHVPCCIQECSCWAKRGASRAERTPPPCGQQPIDAWHHVPCCSCIQECSC